MPRHNMFSGGVVPHPNLTKVDVLSEMKGNKMNKVWIEIERDADKAVNHERAEKFTNLLGKLGSTKEVWLDETKNHYCITTDDAGSFAELTDSGDWFNLDAFGDLNWK